MTSKNGSKRREKAKWAGYLNFRPNDSERAAIRESLLTFPQAIEVMAAWADNGYKVSVKHDDYRNTLVVEIYGYWADCKNPGRTLTVAHSDVLVAISAAAWFVAEIAEDGVWPDYQQMKLPYDW